MVSPATRGFSMSSKKMERMGNINRLHKIGQSFWPAGHTSSFVVLMCRYRKIQANWLGNLPKWAQNRPAPDAAYWQIPDSRTANKGPPGPREQTFLEVSGQFTEVWKV